MKCSSILLAFLSFATLAFAPATVASDFTTPSAEELANEQWGPAGGATPSATPAGAASSVFDTGAGVNGTVYAAVSLPDGSIVIGGEFNSVDSQPRSNIARILADGTLDTTMFGKFTDGVNGTVYALAADSAGAVLIGGYFSEAQEKQRQNLVRYTTDGTLDQSFGGTQQPIGPNGKVLAIAVQPDGGIVIGGEFSGVGTAQRHNVARLNADGSVAGSQVAVSGVSGTVSALTVTASGAVVAGGTFEVAGSTSRSIGTVQP